MDTESWETRKLNKVTDQASPLHGVPLQSEVPGVGALLTLGLLCGEKALCHPMWCWIRCVLALPCFLSFQKIMKRLIKRYVLKAQVDRENDEVNEGKPQMRGSKTSRSAERRPGMNLPMLGCVAGVLGSCLVALEEDQFPHLSTIVMTHFYGEEAPKFPLLCQRGCGCCEPKARAQTAALVCIWLCLSVSPEPASCHPLPLCLASVIPCLYPSFQLPPSVLRRV